MSSVQRFSGRKHVTSDFEFITTGAHLLNFSFSVEFDADFADIFEVRGVKRERRGYRVPTQLVQDGLVLAYNGLD